MELSALKDTFNIFTQENSNIYPRLTISMVGGNIVNIENVVDNKILLTKDYMKIDTPKSITYLCNDDIIRIILHKN